MDFIRERMAARCRLPEPENALPGRERAMVLENVHAVLNTPIQGPYPDDVELIYFGMGCFWGAERLFWRLQGVFTTAVGYMAGYTPNPTYEEVCSGKTGHNEAVLVAYHREKIQLNELLSVFWESHDPTQGMRQGNDVGTQYRSGVYFTRLSQEAIVLESAKAYQNSLSSAGLGGITTEIAKAGEFYFAELYHQQYLHKNPDGYCGLGGTGVSCYP